MDVAATDSADRRAPRFVTAAYNDIASPAQLTGPAHYAQALQADCYADMLCPHGSVCRVDPCCSPTPVRSVALPLLFTRRSSAASVANC